MLLGRDSECEAIDGLLDAARDSRSGVLVVRGEAGIGKTALLQRALAGADGMRVLTGAGVEAESELPFEDRPQQLMQAGEGQLGLSLDAGAREHAHPVGARQRALQQRGLADPRLAAQHEHAAA